MNVIKVFIILHLFIVNLYGINVITLTNTNSNMDGYVDSSGIKNVVQNWIKVGDFTNNALRQGFAGICLKSIPPTALVTSATLFIKRRHGTGLTNYNPFYIDLVDFGDSLTSADYDSPVLAEYSNLGRFIDNGTAVLETLSFPVTKAVQYCIDMPKLWNVDDSDKWFQVKFYSLTPADNNNTDDSMWIGTSDNSNAVYLRIYYTNRDINTNTEEIISVTLSLTNVVTGLDRNFTGINAAILKKYTDPWNSVEIFSNAIHRMGVRKIRYPGGTISQTWDWILGKADSYPSSYYYPADTKTAVDVMSGDVSWVLNMNKTIEHNITGLSNALKSGVPIKYIEMHNEAYYDTNFNGDNGITYAQQCKLWIDKLHQSFPGVKCAVDQTMKYTSSMLDWQQNVFTYCDNYDAVIIHWYVSLKGIDSSSGQTVMWNDFTNKNGLAELLGSPQYSWDDLTAHNNLPDNINIWMTEFDLNSAYEPVIKHTWAHALFVLNQINVMLNDGRIKWFMIQQLDRGGASCMWEDIDLLSDYTNYFPLTENLTTTPGELTAKGIVIKQISSVINGATNGTALEFHNVPIISASNISSYPALVGWKFSHPENYSTAFLLNLSSESYKIDTSGFWYSSGTVYQITNNPIRIIPREDVLVVNNLGNVPAVLTLPAYSFTTIIGDKSVTILSNNNYLNNNKFTTLDDAIAGPVPIGLAGNEKLRFENLTDTAKVKIYSIIGELVITLADDNNDGIIEWNLHNKNNDLISPGVYVCIISDDYGNKKYLKIAVKK